MATITFSCHKCGQVLRAGSAAAGKKAKCPKCASVVPIPAPAETEIEAVVPETRVKSGKPKPGPPPLPPSALLRDEEDEAEEAARPKRRRDEEQDEEPRPRKLDDEDEPEKDDGRPKGMSKRARWAKVRLGVMLTFISACVLIGYGAISTLGSLILYIAVLATSPGMGDVSQVLVKVGVVLNFLLQFPAVVGYGFTLLTPNKRKALAFAIACVAMGVVNLGLKTIAVIALFGRRMDGPGIAGMPGIPNLGVSTLAGIIVVTILMLLILASEWILYPLFLRAAALNLKEKYLAGTALMPMFFACGFVAVQTLSVILIFSMIDGGFAGPSRAMVHVIMILSILSHAVLTTFAVIYMRAQSHVRAAIG